MLQAQRAILLSGRGPVERNKTMPIMFLHRHKVILFNSRLLNSGLLALLAIPFIWPSVVLADTGSNQWGQSWSGGSSYGRSIVRKWAIPPAKGFPTLSKSNIAPLQAAIKYYETIVARGGWRPMPMVQLRPGMRHSSVAPLRQHLELTHDLAPSRRYSKRYDRYMQAAVKNFQRRHGLKVTGKIDRRTVMALDVTAEARLRQLRTNLSRLRTLTRSTAKKYVVVNIPAAQIEAIENDEVVSRHEAVVGKADRQTPVLRSRVHQINFNPYWTIPRSIIRKDLVPKARLYARSGKDILSEYRIDAYSGKGKLNPRTINWNSSAVYNYTYRQQPWKDNSLGFVKINFNNVHSVYMHDTPSKSLFARNFRAQSSGCVRVQNVKQLVSWLLESNQGWDFKRVSGFEQTGARQDVSLKKTVPVYFVYVTAWATKDGKVNFRRDVYGRDQVGATASAY